jgi:hypothetical protein
VLPSNHVITISGDCPLCLRPPPKRPTPDGGTGSSGDDGAADEGGTPAPDPGGSVGLASRADEAP